MKIKCWCGQVSDDLSHVNRCPVAASIIRGRDWVTLVQAQHADQSIEATIEREAKTIEEERETAS